MDGVKQQVHARQIEAMENRHQFEIKKRNRKMREEVDKLGEASKTTLSRLKKDYDSQIATEKSNLEVKLIEVRKKNNEILKDENTRYNKMVEELKANHESKMSELQLSQSKEVENKKMEHTEYMENVERKLQEEKAKNEV